jgi:RNA polymerase sigma-70 factor (ECF subfamily)
MSKTVFFNNKVVEACKQNNAKAQMQLYDMYCDAMFTIALRYVKDSFVAEDIMQDAFIKVFKNMQYFKGEVTIGAWIKKIVINQCIDYLKKKKIELVSIDEKQLTIEDAQDWIVKDEVAVDFIISAINSLPEKYKVVLNLYLIEGFSHKEIATFLNITEVASRTQLMRGKTKLKGQLKQYNYA